MFLAAKHAKGANLIQGFKTKWFAHFASFALFAASYYWI